MMIITTMRMIRNIIASNRMKTHTFNGRKYRIYLDPDLDGWCDQYKCNELGIHLLKDLKTRAGLITAIHETLHAVNWRASEEKVDQDSKEIGAFLWRLGYRRKE